ncbi:MAG: glycosyltransferase [Hyphomicrobiaceae bacterium]|nr:glycosyltransferase [Hyphomicrobiaceae bacterium]
MPRRMLIAYSSSSTFVQTTLDYMLMLKKHLNFDVDFVHVTHGAVMDFDIDDYDVVFNNYCARHCFKGYVSTDFCAALKAFRGLKVLAVQDEYDHTNVLKAAIQELGFDIVLTCVPQSSLEYVYPRHDFPDVEFMTVFTGYVADPLVERGATVKPLAQRTIPVGYRGRDIGGKYGRLGFDKFEIGRRMKVECDSRGIKNDIAMDEDSRIYGPAWFDFIENCRTMLGSESGSNVFDFDSSLDRKFKELTAVNGGRRPSYEIFAPYIAEHDAAISMGQISPRVFECAALRTPMILFRGKYSDVLEPDEHYIALEKDFSNADDVLARLDDLPGLDAMANRAHNHLIASGRYTYQAFASELERRITARLAALRTDQRGVHDARAATSAGSMTASVDSLPLRMSGGLYVLAEQPTALPQTVAAFDLKHRRLSFALAKEAVRSIGSPREFINLAMSSAYALRYNVFRNRLLRKIWRYTPERIRNRIMTAVG